MAGSNNASRAAASGLRICRPGLTKLERRRSETLSHSPTGSPAAEKDCRGRAHPSARRAARQTPAGHAVIMVVCARACALDTPKCSRGHGRPVSSGSPCDGRGRRHGPTTTQTPQGWHGCAGRLLDGAPADPEPSSRRRGAMWTPSTRCLLACLPFALQAEQGMGCCSWRRTRGSGQAAAR